MEISGDIDELIAATKGLGVARTAIARANVSAINKTATTLRAEAVRLVFKEYNLKHRQIRSEINIRKATLQKQEARLHGSGSPGVPLHDFSPTPRRVPSTRRLSRGGYTPKGGITVMVRRGERKIVKGAFVAKMRSGHVGVFRRAENGRWGVTSRKPVIEELFGPSVVRILDSDRFAIPLDDYAGEVLDKNLAHEIDFFFKKYGVIPDNV